MRRLLFAMGCVSVLIGIAMTVAAYQQQCHWPAYVISGMAFVTGVAYMVYSRMQ